VKRHDADATSLVFGLLFLGLVVAWGLGYAGVLHLEEARVLAPLALIGAGIIGLGVSLRRSRRATRAKAVDDLRDETPVEGEEEKTLVLGDGVEPPPRDGGPR